jgi:dihydroflavonol-4-reductase
MAETTDTLVTVTGATGFIARRVIADLLRDGYRVRGTVRQLTSEGQLRQDLETAVGADALNRLEIVAANLMAEGGWSAALAGATYVHHVASPIPSAPPKDPNDLIVPARDGTLRVLKAATAAGVQRVVLTSSMAAVAYGVDRRDKVFTAEDWSQLDDHRIGAYETSKTLAERAARSYAAETGLSLYTINPGLVLGPGIGGEVSTSLEAVAKLMKREVPAVPNIVFPCVDVRDVAAGHVAAMTTTLSETRLLAADQSVSLRAIADILATTFGPQGFRIPTRPLPSILLKVLARFDGTVRLALNDLDRPVFVDNAPFRALLGRDLISLSDMVVASAETLLASGAVRRRRGRTSLHPS